MAARQTENPAANTSFQTATTDKSATMRAIYQI